VTDRDLPQLIAALGNARGPLEGPAPEGFASAIAKLHWEPHQRELLELMDKNDGAAAPNIAPILLQRPKALDIDYICSNFDHALPRSRRVYCALLGKVKQNDQTVSTLLRALADSSPAVRVVAANVLAENRGQADKTTGPLLERLADENEFVTASVASALARLNATNAAPGLFTNL
jgi:hypothetical protein